MVLSTYYLTFRFVCQADYIVTDDGHFQDASDSSFPTFRVMGLDEFASQMIE